MSIVTKTGDAGATALMYGRRVSKCDPRVEAYGTVDELNSALGLARALAGSPDIQRRLSPIHPDLVVLMGELATHPDDLDRFARDGFHSLGPEFTARLETQVKEIEAQGGSFSGWATPGSNPGSGALDLARTVCRRAERLVCALHERGQLRNAEILVYLNRLSDLLWLLARQAEH